ncbi:MAG: EF-hand domain-containing protein [Pseudolabrys sp.]|nr:EF-hand domain-containing protein [Pseudolabrys sp.]
MSMSVGASSSSALSYLQQLMQQKGAKEAKKSEAADPLAMLLEAVSGGEAAPAQTGQTQTAPATGVSSKCAAFSPDTMSALLAAQSDDSTAATKLFSKLDANGDGTISKDEFSTAASKAGADSSVADAVYAKIDGDGDGSISQAELSKADRGPPHHHHAGPPPSDMTAATTTTTADSTKSALIDQWMKLQSQVLTIATSTLSAVA